MIASLCLLATILMTPEIHEKYLISKSKSVVKLTSTTGSSGTGFVIRHKLKKYILTNRHVCTMHPKFLTASIGNKVFTTRIIKYSETDDLCLMTAPQNLPYLGIRGLNLRGMSKAYTIGHPLGLPLTFEKGLVTSEEVIRIRVSCKRSHDLSYKPRDLMSQLFGIKKVCIKVYDAVRVNSFTYPGNSGSPVLDWKGHVQGVIFAGSTRAANAGYMVPLRKVRRFLESISL